MTRRFSAAGDRASGLRGGTVGITAGDHVQPPHGKPTASIRRLRRSELLATHRISVRCPRRTRHPRSAHQAPGPASGPGW
jgi:hypothetical protein